MEGIMMRNQDQYSIAVRKPDQEIEIKVEPYKSVINCKPLLKIPIVRGGVSFIDSLVVGIKCLMYSATFFEEEEDPKKQEMSEEERKAQEEKEKKQEKAMMTGTLIFSIVIAVAVFMMLPYFLTNLLRQVIASKWIISLLESIVRVVIFLGYLLLVSPMKDIQRTFMYHGAEHKTIFCYENGLELTVDNVRKMSRFHPRCGTSFMFVMIIISVFISSVLVLIFPHLAEINRILWMLIKLCILPLVMGLGYEFIKFAGKHDNVLVKILSYPGLLMQHITTNEPEDDVIEVAIESIKAVITDNPEDDRIK